MARLTAGSKFWHLKESREEIDTKLSTLRSDDNPVSFALKAMPGSVWVFPSGAVLEVVAIDA